MLILQSFALLVFGYVTRLKRYGRTAIFLSLVYGSVFTIQLLLSQSCGFSDFAYSGCAHSLLELLAAPFSTIITLAIFTWVPVLIGIALWAVIDKFRANAV